MTHYRDGQNNVFECDDCQDDFGNLDGDDATFAECWAAAKEQGWICFKVDDEWQHRCPECRKKVGG